MSARRYAAVAGVAAALYLNSLTGEFVHDDVVAVVRNHDVLGATPLAQLLTNDFWGTALADPRSHKSYRPLTTLSFRLNHHLCGLHPLCFHGVSVLLHVACSLLLTRVALVVARLDTRFATVAGLLFSAHPVHTEAVAGIVGRADVLACLLFLLSLLSYHDEGWCMRGGRRLALSCVLAALAMLAKETGLTVLLVNLALDTYHNWPHFRRSLVKHHMNDESRRLARRTVTVLLTISMLLVFRLAMLQGSLPKFSPQDNPAAFHPSAHVRLMTHSYLGVFNSWLLLCPATLSHDWQMGSIPLVTSPLDPRNLATALFLGFCLLLALRAAAAFDDQKQVALVLGSLLLVVPFLPATNIFFTVGFVVAERVLYIPSAGFSLLVAYGAQRLHHTLPPGRSGRAVLLANLLLLGVAFSCKTIVRNNAWADREALLRAGLTAVPHNAKLHYNLANLLRDSNSPDLARRHYQEALRLWPSYASAHNNLGTLMTSAAAAESHFRSAITISPSHVNAHYNLGQVYRKMNRSMEAVAMLERCLRLDTSYSPAYLVLAKLHPPPLAERLLRHVTRLLPNTPDYQAYFADWLLDRGMILEAQTFYFRALRLQNNHLSSFLGLGRCLRARGQLVRLHQLLVRWYLLHRGRGQGGRLIHAAEIYVTSSAFHRNQEDNGSDKDEGMRWWQGLGDRNKTKACCCPIATHGMSEVRGRGQGQVVEAELCSRQPHS